MADERIDIIIQDKVDSTIETKLTGIANASNTADSALSKLQQSLAAIGSGGLANLQQQLSLAASATSALAAAQGQLQQSISKTQLQNIAAATAQEKLNAATANAEAALNRAISAENNAAASAQRLAIAKQQLETAQLRTAQASSQAELAALRLKQAQDNSVNSVSGLNNELYALAMRLIMLVGIYKTFKDLIEASDVYIGMQNKVRSTGEAEANLGSTIEKIGKTANDTYGVLEDTAKLYQRLTIATKDLGASQDQVVRITKTLNEAVAMSGVSASAAKQGLYQLAMGMEADRLQGQHLKSVIQDMPMIARMLAGAMGTNLEGLRKMGAAGELTSAQLAQAILKISKDVDDMFGRVTPQASQAMNVLNTQFTLFIGKLSDSSGAGRALSATIIFLADHIDILTVAVISLGVAMLAAFGPSILAGIGAMLAPLSALSFPALALVAAVTALASAWLLAGKNFEDYKNKTATEAPKTQHLTTNSSNVENVLGDLKLTENQIKSLTDAVNGADKAQLGSVLSSLRQQLMMSGRDVSALDKYVESLNSATRDMESGQKEAAKAIDDLDLNIKKALLTLPQFEEELKKVAHINFDSMTDDFDKAMRHADEKIKILQSGGRSSDAQPAINLGDRQEKLGKAWDFALKQGSSDEVFNALKRQNDQLGQIFNKETQVKNLEEQRRDSAKKQPRELDTGDTLQMVNAWTRKVQDAERHVQSLTSDFTIQMKKMSADYYGAEEEAINKWKIEQLNAISNKEEAEKLSLAVLQNRIQKARGGASSELITQYNTMAEMQPKVLEFYEQQKQKIIDISELKKKQLEIEKLGSDLTVAQLDKFYFDLIGSYKDQETAAEKVLEIEEKRAWFAAKTETEQRAIARLYEKQRELAGDKGFANTKAKSLIEGPLDNARMIDNYKSIYDRLEEMRKADLEHEHVYQSAKIQLWQNTYGAQLDATSQFFSNLSTVMGEQSEAGKALAIASGTIQAILSSIKAYTAALDIPIIGPYIAPVFAGVAFAAQMAAVAKIKSSPAYETGGYTGNLPTNAMAGIVHGQEYVFDAASTRAIGVDNLEAMRRNASAMTNGGSTRAGVSKPVPPNLTIYNYGPPVEEQWISPEEVRLISRKEAVEAVHKHAPEVIRRDLSNPNSSSSKGVSQAFKVQRNR